MVMEKFNAYLPRCQPDREGSQEGEGLETYSPQSEKCCSIFVKCFIFFLKVWDEGEPS